MCLSVIYQEYQHIIKVMTLKIGRLYIYKVILLLYIKKRDQRADNSGFATICHHD